MFEVVPVALCALCMSYFAKLLYARYKIWQILKHIPGENGNFLYGNIPEKLRNLDRLYETQEALVQQHGPTIRMHPHLFFPGGYILTSPENIEHVLSTNMSNYIKPPNMLRAFNTLLGHGIFTSNHRHKYDTGQLWYLQRKIAAKVFSANQFRVFSKQVFLRHGTKLVDQLEEAAATHTVVDIQQLFLNFTLSTIFNIGFGCDIPDDACGQQFQNAFDRATELSTLRMLKPWYRVFGRLLSSERELYACIEVLDQVIRTLVRERQQEDQESLRTRHDILSLFLQRSREMDIGDLDLDEFLRGVCMAIMIAGRDTTASGLTYMFYRLGKHPDILEKLTKEIDEALQGQSPSYDNLNGLKYLDAVVHETLRLYPPVPFDPKYCVEDDVLPDGTKVPAGIVIQYSPWIMGQREELWPQASLFRPERWLEMEKKPSPYKFATFQAGPRICIGQNMALIEMKIAACLILQKYQFQLESTDEPQYRVSAVLHMKHGLKGKVIPRVFS